MTWGRAPPRPARKGHRKKMGGCDHVMRVSWRQIRHRIGHRGAFLLFAGAYNVFYGWYLAAGGQIQHVPLIPERTWGWLWITIGLWLICGAFARRHDAVFFAAGILIKTIWGLEFFRLNWQAHIPNDWLRGCYWLAFAAITLVVATWPEPVRAVTPPGVPATAAETVQRARDA